MSVSAAAHVESPSTTPAAARVLTPVFNEMSTSGVRRMSRTVPNFGDGSNRTGAFGSLLPSLSVSPSVSPSLSRSLSLLPLPPVMGPANRSTVVTWTRRPNAVPTR